MNSETTVEDRIRALFDDSVSKFRCTDDNLSKYYVFDNQISTAKDIIYNFYLKRHRWCLLFAEMQSGKSGTFFSIPYIISRNKTLIDKLGIDMSDNEINVFLLTGMNEKELISQFEKDIDGFTGMDITKNVLHNSEMRKFLSKPEDSWNTSDKTVINKMRKNSLILIDESHYGSDKNQVLDKFLRKILNINPNGDNTPLIENNVYVVSISATPMAEFINSNISDFKKKIIPLKNSNGYFGIVDMFNENRVFDSYDLKDDKSCNLLIDKILNMYKNGYILIRCTQKQQNRLVYQIGKRMISALDIINYDQYSKSTILDNMGINDILSEIPNKKTLIFLKGLLRAGKRVNTQNVIMVHDTSVSNVDTTVQSLLGRCCGYGKNRDIDIYCDKISAKKYKNWVLSGYDLNHIPDKSKNILGDSSISICSYRDPILFDVSNNKFIIDNLNIRAKRGQALSRNIDILKSLNSDDINIIIDSGILGTDYTIGTIFKVDITKHNKWIEGGDKYTSYQKQFLDVLNNNIFLGDYKPEESISKMILNGLSEEDSIKRELGKIVFSAAYDIGQKKLLVSFGRVIKNNIKSSDKSMYHLSNQLA